MPSAFHLVAPQSSLLPLTRRLFLSRSPDLGGRKAAWPVRCAACHLPCIARQGPARSAGGFASFSFPKGGSLLSFTEDERTKRRPPFPGKRCIF